MSQFTLNLPIRNNFYNGTPNDSRMYVRPGVYLPNGEIDFNTGMLRETERRVGRTQALRREAHQLDTEYANLQAMLKARANEKGRRIPLKAAFVLVLFVLVVFSVILLVQQGNIATKQETIRQINSKNNSAQSVVDGISAQVDEASDPVRICYVAARDLDMVPAESAQAIYLSALSTRPNQDPIAIRASNE